MDLFDIALWILGLILSFILGFFTSWYFHRKQRKENEANAEVLKQIQQYVDAEIRLGNDKRGKIVKRPDGTIAIDWKIELVESVGVSATPKVEVEKKREKENL
jgi:type II secretory pathway pseudopilin PulG